RFGSRDSTGVSPQRHRGTLSKHRGCCRWSPYRNTEIIMKIAALGSLLALLLMLPSADSSAAQPPLATHAAAAVPFASLSYAPFVRGQTPAARPTDDQIRSDLELLAPYTHTVRIYAPENGLE